MIFKKPLKLFEGGREVICGKKDWTVISNELVMRNPGGDTKIEH
jgi:hypothetical protein